jgi:hypothetical protein
MQLLMLLLVVVVVVVCCCRRSAHIFGSLRKQHDGDRSIDRQNGTWCLICSAQDAN